MIILNINAQKKNFILKPEDIDDLWVLSKIIDKGDIVSALTERKIKLNSGDERKSKIIKKKIILKINVEKTEFHKYTGHLRISGKIIEGKEDISAGTYHTLDVSLDKEIHITKKTLLDYHIKKVKSATHKKNKIMIGTFDRSNLIIYELKPYGAEQIGVVKGNVKKKDLVEMNNSDFFEEIIKTIEDKSEQFDKIILASPEFWKKYLINKVKSSKIKNKTQFITINSIGINGIKEVLKNTEFKNILKESLINDNSLVIEELLKNIKKEQKAVYGYKETKNAIEQGSVEKLLVSEKLINKLREKDNFDELEYLMKITEEMGGKIHITSPDFEAGKTLDGLGGIAAITRF